MYLKLISGRSVCQIASTCFCQGNSIYAQYTVVALLSNKSLFLKKYFMSNNSLNNIPLMPASSLLQKKYVELPTVCEQNFSSANENQEVRDTPALSKKDKLKKAVKDYGATVIIFHVTISLMSLGISYLVISSGVDVASLLSKLGLDSKSELATGASTFVVAYAVHKIFAPVRISITLGFTPFIVRYLRRVGILKPPKSSGL